MKNSISKKGGISGFVVVLLVVGSFSVGMFWNRMKGLEEQVANLKGSVKQDIEQPNNVGNQGVARPTQSPVSIDKIKALFNDKNIYFGDKNSDLLFVEVADPACPYCQVAAGKNPELSAKMGARFTLVADGGNYVAPVEEMRKMVNQGKAAFVYLYFPGHGVNGEMGMKAIYCGHEQSAFWKIHDLLMTNDGYNLLNNTVKNDKTKSQKLVDFLKDVVDGSKLKKCLDSGKYDSKLIEDRTTASGLGVRGTPGFFVNTTNFKGAYSWIDMKSALDL